jgi:hypothetical protein
MNYPHAIAKQFAEWGYHMITGLLNNSVWQVKHICAEQV